jgi:hypothetical protein
MNATKHLGLVLFLTLAAGVATAAITHGDGRSTKVAAPQETVGEIPRVVITASRQAADSEECETAIPRVVVIGRRADLAALTK